MSVAGDIDLSLVLYLTLLEIGLGMGAVHLFIPRSALGPGFGKTISTSIFFSLLFAMLGLRRFLPSDEGDLFSAVRAAGWSAIGFWFAYFVALNYPREGFQRILILIALFFQVALVLATSLLMARHYWALGHPAAQAEVPEELGTTVPQLFLSLAVGISSSGLLLGSVTMAMLIGHWYLVIPGLAIRWLKGSCLAFAFAIVFKALSVWLSMTIGVRSDPFGAEGFLDRAILSNLIFLTLRYFIGLLLPAVACGMAYRSAAIRSTQSATGILFPAMILVLLGEMIGSYLIIGLWGLCL